MTRSQLLQSRVTALKKKVEGLRRVEASRRRLIVTMNTVADNIEAEKPASFLSPKAMANFVWRCSFLDKPLLDRCKRQIFSSVSGVFHGALLDWLLQELPELMDSRYKMRFEHVSLQQQRCQQLMRHLSQRAAQAATAAAPTDAEAALTLAQFQRLYRELSRQQLQQQAQLEALQAEESRLEADRVELMRALVASGSCALRKMKQVNVLMLKRTLSEVERLCLVEADFAEASNTLLHAPADMRAFKIALHGMDASLTDAQLEWLFSFGNALVDCSRAAETAVDARHVELQAQCERQTPAGAVRLRLFSEGVVIAEGVSEAKRMRRSHSP